MIRHQDLERHLDQGLGSGSQKDYKTQLQHHINKKRISIFRGQKKKKADYSVHH